MNDTKEKIIRQALIYFNTNDYERASLNEIAGALGITKGAIYHYFGSKDELFRETALHTLEELEGQFQNLTRRPEGRPFREVILAWFSFEEMGAAIMESMGIDIFADYQNGFYMIFTALRKFPEIRDKIGSIYESLLTDLEKMLNQARNRGELRQDVDTEALAFELTAYGEGAMLLRGFLPALPLGRLSRRNFDDLWNRIAP
jgi:AcrR family transcriptional regulator